MKIGLEVKVATDSVDDNIYMVLDGPTRSEFAKVAADLGFMRHNVWEPAAPREVYEEVWATPDQTRALNYVEDPVLGMPFVRIRGNNLYKLAGDVTRKLSVFSPEELIERAYREKDHNEQVNNLYRLAITFPKYDQAVFEIFEGFATRAPNPLLRRAALDAMTYRGWPEFRPVLERVSREDGVEEVRRHANELLTAWDDRVPGKSEPKN